MHIRKQSEEINKKKIDSIYVIRYTALAQACLKAKCWRVDDKVQTSFLINFERAVVCSINRAPTKLVGLWEEEQTRSSSICSANSYDKRIATSERSYEGIGVCGRLGGKPRQMFEGSDYF